MPEESTFDKVRRLFNMGKTNSEIMNEIGVAEKTVRNYISIIRNLEQSTNKNLNANIDIQSDNDLDITSLSEKLGIDLDEWQPTNIVGNQWGDNKQLKIKYSRIIPDDVVHKAIQNVVNKINNGKIKTPKTPKIERADTLLEISLYDHHFGKLAHYEETGSKYNLELAKKLYEEAVDNILYRAENSNKIDKILFPVGQDLFHINNDISTTASGTFQDTDTRLIKIFETVQETLISCVDKMLEVAPVDIVYVADNHGPIASYFLCKVLESYYKDNSNVTFETNNRSRKYYKYGNTLIGMCHGHSEKSDVLALTMACEAKELWANTEFHEFHCGHFHKKSEKKYNTVDSLGDVIVRYLPSLCGTDKWHESKAYNTTRKFCECYLFSKEEGPIGSLIYNKKKE